MLKSFIFASRHTSQWWPATVEEYRDGCQMYESKRIWLLNYDEHQEFPSETMRVCFVSGDEMKTLENDDATVAQNAPVVAAASLLAARTQEVWIA